MFLNLRAIIAFSKLTCENNWCIRGRACSLEFIDWNVNICNVGNEQLKFDTEINVVK